MHESPDRKQSVRSGPPKFAYWLCAMTCETLRPVPIMEMMDSGPDSRWKRRTFSSMRSYASSQVTRSSGAPFVRRIIGW